MQAAIKGNVFTDLRTAAGLFGQLRKARKNGEQIEIVPRKQFPFMKCGGFYNTVEGCTLGHLDEDIEDSAQAAFDSLPEEIKEQLYFAPKEGEFVERALFWKELLKPFMSSKQLKIAMVEILDWYIHIKKMRVLV